VQKQILAARDEDSFLPDDNESRAPAAAQVSAPLAAPVSGPSIQSVRVGDHSPVTRVVLDASAKPAYTAHMEQGGRQLVVDLPDTGWNAAAAAKLHNKNAAAYKYEDGHAIFDLSAPMQIKTQQILPPQGKAGYRIMIDLVASAS
jgi:hypothetical protein